MREEEGGKMGEKDVKKDDTVKKEILKEKTDKGLEINISKVSTQKVNAHYRR